MHHIAFAYVVYGDNPTFWRQLTLSLATLLDRTSDTPVLVVADDPQKVPKHRRIVPIPLDVRGTHDGRRTKNFALKLGGISQLLECHAERIIFLDTDTRVRSNLNRWFDRIGPHSSLMHRREGQLSSKRFGAQYAPVLGKLFIHPVYGDFVIKPDWPMYNSGLIGLDRVQLGALAAARWLFEAIDPLVNIHTSEQLALGQMLARYGQVLTVGERGVRHYWHLGPKRWVDEQSALFLERVGTHKLMNNPDLSRHFPWRRSFSRWLADKRRHRNLW